MKTIIKLHGNYDYEFTGTIGSYDQMEKLGYDLPEYNEDENYAGLWLGLRDEKGLFAVNVADVDSVSYSH